jgi:hypothetical protein
VRRDQQCEPGEPEEPREDNVGEPVVAEKYPTESHRCRRRNGEQHTQGHAEAARESVGNQICDHSGDDPCCSARDSAQAGGHRSRSELRPVDITFGFASGQIRGDRDDSHIREGS